MAINTHFTVPKRRLGWKGAVLGLAFLLGAASASAQSFLVNKKFEPENISAEAETTLSFNLFNSRDETLTATVKDTLPVTDPIGQLWFDPTAPLQVENGSAQGTCTTGTASFSDFIDAEATKARTVTITGASVPQRPAGTTQANCTVSLPVYSGRVGEDKNYINEVPEGDAFAEAAEVEYPSEEFSATLHVRAPVNPIKVNKSFAPTLVTGGSTSTLTITIKNDSDPAETMEGVGFTDNLPTGLFTAGVPDFSASCGSPSTTTEAGHDTVVMSGGSIAAGATCTVTVDVTAPTTGDGAFVNEIPADAVTANGGFKNEVGTDATLTVRNTVKMTKTFGTTRTDSVPEPANLYGSPALVAGTTAVDVGQAVQVRVYFSNPGSSALTGGNLTDNLPNGVVAVGGPVSGTCTNLPSGDIPAGAQTIAIDGFEVPAASDGQPGSCYVQFWVKATTSFTSNTNELSTSNVSFTGSPTVDAATSATLRANDAPGTGGAGAVTVEKRFYRQDGASQTGPGAPLQVEKGEEFWMRVAVRNTRYDATYTNGTVVDTLPLGLRVANPQDVRVLQNAPSGFHNGASYPLGCGNQDASSHTTDGTVTVSQDTDGRDVITYSGFTLHNGAGSNNTTQRNQGCFYAIKLVSDADDEFTGGGDYINTIDANTVTFTDGVTNPSGVTARVAVLSDLDTSKSFSPADIGGAGGAVTRLTIAFDNKNASTDVTGLAVSDPLPGNDSWGQLKVADPANVENTCGGTVTAASGSKVVSLAGGTVASGMQCHIAVDVVHEAGTSLSGNITNTIAANGVTNDQGQTNPLPVTATLSKNGNAGISVVKKFDGDGSVLGGHSARLRLTFAATSASTMEQDLITLTDNMPSGMLVAPNPNVSTTCKKKDGTTDADVVAEPGAQEFTISGFYFSQHTDGAAPHNTCVLELDVAMSTTGNKTNTIDARSIITSAGTTNNSATQDTLTAQANTALQKSFQPAEILVGQTSLLTLSVVNVNTEARNGFDLTDTLPTGMVVAADPQAATTCGGGNVTAQPGSGQVQLAGASVDANATCTVSVQVEVEAGGDYRNTGPDNVTATSYIDRVPADATLKALAPASISGHVYHDANDDGVKDPGEAAIPGVTVTLRGDDGDERTIQTDEDGFYEFTMLKPGVTYTVTETQPAAPWQDGKDTPGSVFDDEQADEPQDAFIVTPGEDEHGTDWNFGELMPAGATASISGHVYHDANDDGLKGVDEDAIPDVLITLSGDDGSVRTVRTDSSGYYEFTGLMPGVTYTVTETQPDSWVDGKDTAGTEFVEKGGGANDSFVVTPDADQHGENWNFGEKRDESATASISGYVYHDANDDGVKDVGEAALPGVLVTLQGSNGETRTTVTDASGFYEFAQLTPGVTYTVTETQPGGWTDGKDTAGTEFVEEGGGANDSFVVTPDADQHGENWNFGELERNDVTPGSDPASISGHVYHDRNNNGVFDGSEDPIPGVTITLQGSNGDVRTVVTDDDGYWSFTNLVPGVEYTVVETQPEGWLDGKDTAGSVFDETGGGMDDRFSFTPGPGEDGEDWNFGERQPEVAPIPTLGEWALLLMMGLLAAFGAGSLRRRSA